MKACTQPLIEIGWLENKIRYTSYFLKIQKLFYFIFFTNFEVRGLIRRLSMRLWGSFSSATLVKGVYCITPKAFTEVKYRYVCLLDVKMLFWPQSKLQNKGTKDESHSPLQAVRILLWISTERGGHWKFHSTNSLDKTLMYKGV